MSIVQARGLEQIECHDAPLACCPGTAGRMTDTVLYSLASSVCPSGFLMRIILYLDIGSKTI